MHLTKNLRRPRMLDWLIYALVLALLVWCVAPQQLPVSLYKLSLVALASVVGYWIDRSLFPYARPDMFLMLATPDEPMEDEGPDGAEITMQSCPDEALLRLMGLAMLRRALIVAATMLAAGLGA